jgi:hypothetical protein
MQHFSLFWLRLSFRKHCHFQTAAEVHATSLNERGCSRSQKKRRQQSRRGNTVSEKPTGFSGKKPPCPTKSGSAAKTEKIESFVYCPSNLVRALQFCSPCLSDLCMSIWRLQFVSPPGGPRSIDARSLLLTFASCLFPVQRTAGLVFDHACLEEVTFFFQIDHLAHPRERIFFLREHRIETDLLCAAISDES